MPEKKLFILFGGPDRLFLPRINVFLHLHSSGEVNDLLFVGNHEEEVFLRKQLDCKKLNLDIKVVYSWNTATNISLSKEVWQYYETLIIASEKYHLKRIMLFFSREGRTNGIKVHELDTKEKWNAPLLYWVYFTKFGTVLASFFSKLLFKGKWGIIAKNEKRKDF